MAEPTKRCPGCPLGANVHPLSEFNRAATRSDGHDWQCRKCKSKAMAAQRVKAKARSAPARVAALEAELAALRGGGTPEDFEIIEGEPVEDERAAEAEAKAVRLEQDRRRREAPPIADEFAELVRLTRRGEMEFADLCDSLNLSPSRARDILERARAAGVNVAVSGNHVALGLPETTTTIRQVEVAGVVGGHQEVAVISDIHFGNKHHLRAQLADFIDYAYDKGVREILCPGDVLDGIYRFARFEQNAHGIDEQADQAAEYLPQKPGLSYHSITGNHEETFTEQNGIEVGSYLTARFKAAGRDDLHFYGNRGAHLMLRGAHVHLWHPRSGVSYARSYALQKQLEKYASGEKPQILLAGHWHVYCHIYERGVHAFACPTFQGGGSAFGKSIGGSPAIGGMMLGWDLTADGTMRGLTHEYRAYFEIEKPHRLDDRDNAIPVDVPGVKSRA